MLDKKILDKALAVASLREFTRKLWRFADPSGYVPGWHIDAISEHLEAVSKGQIKRLIINIPPRCMKSLSVSVFWPAWDWLLTPWRRFLYSSYSQALSTRDSVKCRNVIQSPAYADLMYETYPDFYLVSDQNTKTRFDNNMKGYRIATSVGGMTTGEGGDIVVIDDPHNVIDGESEAKRESCLQWWDEVMPTRLNDAKTGAFVIIMQRIHEGDLTGHILAKQHGWDHLCLPARYEGENRVVSSLDFEDPRTEVGEPLWPAHIGDEELKDLESRLTTYAAAGQLQQRPTPRGGNMFHVGDIRVIQNFNPKQVVKAVRYWDKAGTEGGGARTAGVLVCKMMEGCGYDYLIADVVKGQWSYGERERRIKQTAELDADSELPVTVQIWTEQEGGSGGKESSERTVKSLAGFSIHADRVTGDKVTRAEPLAAQVEHSNVAVLSKEWTQDYLHELELFPNSKYKDQVDASTGGFNKLTLSGTKKAGVWGRRR